MKRLCVLFAVILLLLCSCGEKVGGPYFPAVPDKIVIGISGVESTIVPGDEAFDEIVSRVRGVTEQSEGFDFARLDAISENGKHLSYEVRESEIFVEFIYNEPGEQTVIMREANRKTSVKVMNIQRLFFPLSGQYKDVIFIGADAEYKSHSTIGPFDIGESLASYVAGLLAPVD